MGTLMLMHLDAIKMYLKVYVYQNCHCQRYRFLEVIIRWIERCRPSDPVHPNLTVLTGPSLRATRIGIVLWKPARVL